MAYVTPTRTAYRYEVATNANGTPFRGTFADGGHYFNVLSIREGSSAPIRIVARTETLEDARLLADALNCHTVGEGYEKSSSGSGLV